MPKPSPAPPTAPTPEGTAEAILDAAERLFAERGFARTTIKAIAAGAGGVNSALLYYYFGDKDGVYRAVFRRRIEALMAEGMRQLDGAASPADAIRRFARAYMDHMLAHPTMPRLLIREVVDHDAAHAVEEVRRVASGAFQRLCDVIRAGQARGDFRRDLDPAHAALSTLSPVVYVLIARPIVSVLLTGGRGGLTDDTLRAFAEHAADFALAALAPRARPAGD